MAYIEEYDFEEWAAEFPFSSDCFLCGKKLTVPFVMWHGQPNSIIGFHIHCAKEFGERLIRENARLDK
jgi:hypothetical protein